MRSTSTFTPRLLRRGFRWLILAGVLACSWSAVEAQSSTLLNEVHTIAAPTTGVPVEHSFDIPLDGSYVLTLTDIGAGFTPSAPLASLKLAITRDAQVVGVPVIGAGTLGFDATKGTYQLHIIGLPGNTPGSGPIGVKVTNAADGTVVFQSADLIALPNQALPNGEAVLNDTLTVSSAGSYQVTLTDQQLPQSLGTLTMVILAEGTSTPVAILPDPATSAMQATVTLTPNVNYRLFAGGLISGSSNGGLYSATVVPSGGGASVYAKTVAVGATTLLGTAPLTAGNDTLALTDLKYPAALPQMAAAVVFDGHIAGQLAASGTQAFTAQNATYQVFGAASADASATPAAGSFTVQVKSQDGSVAFSSASPVSAAASGISTYAFNAIIPSAGAYLAGLTDFQLPAGFTYLSMGAVQAGAMLATPTTGPGTLNVNAAAGPISLLVFAQPGAGGGLFETLLSTSNATNPVLEVTQGVGALFTSYKVPVTVGGDYRVKATDLGFPQKLASFYLVVTHNGNSVGSVFGGGGALTFNATPGAYFVNFLAQAGGSTQGGTTPNDQAGTYALTVAPAPPAPIVNLSANATTVSANATATLTWTTQNATACTASGGWSGTKNVNDHADVGPLTQTATYTLTCTGDGGSTAQSVTVTVDPPPKGGGGGMIDPTVLLIGAGALLWRPYRRHGRRPS